MRKRKIMICGNKKAILKKLMVKAGLSSKARIGKEQEIVITNDVVVGKEIKKMRNPGRSKTERSCVATSHVFGIVEEEENVFYIETETSFYKLIFI